MSLFPGSLIEFYKRVIFLPQQLKDHLHTLEELRDQVLRSDISQFDSRVEEIERQLHQALISYGISSLVSGESGTARKESGHWGIEDESTSADDMSKCMCCVEY